MNVLYELFNTLSLVDEPLLSAEYLQLQAKSPDVAKKLASLLKHQDSSVVTLAEKIYRPLLSLDNSAVRLGRVIDNKYEIIELIGQGGMSDVYKAHRIDGLIQHTVAVKYFALADSFDTALHTIKKEAQILANLDHHHIVSFLDIGFDDNGEPHIMMEYIEGETLFKFLKNKPSQPAISQAYSTLNKVKTYISSQGVEHGDINPNNVLVDNYGNANIIDFDLANSKKK